MKLACHPDTPCAAVQRLEGFLSREQGSLAVRFELVADLNRLCVPAPATPRFADGLWRHTCFELFLAGEGDAYREFNFSPSGEWAAYGFSGYRSGMSALQIANPGIAIHAASGRLTLEAKVPVHPAGAAALTAVIEEEGGAISYWALEHAPGKPDFHHRAGFVLAA